MNDKLKVDQAILVFALRYSIGRKTYAPSLVIEEIKSNINNVSNNSIEVMIDDIEGHFGSYGDEVDKDNWESFSKYLKNILSKRSNIE